MTDVDEPLVLRVGAKIQFADENGTYTVRAMSERYAICTKPFNPQRTVIYSIIDIQEMMRGPNNLVLNIYDYKTDKGCEESLADLVDGKVELSRRNSIPLVLSE